MCSNMAISRNLQKCTRRVFYSPGADFEGQDVLEMTYKIGDSKVAHFRNGFPPYILFFGNGFSIHEKVENFRKTFESTDS